MKKRLPILIVLTLLATFSVSASSSDTAGATEAKTSQMKAEVNLALKDWWTLGIALNEPDISKLPLATDTDVVLEKKSDSEGIYGYRKVYLYYYVIGSNNMTMSISISSALKKTSSSGDTGSAESVDYTIKFGSTAAPASNWDGGAFQRANTGVSAVTSVKPQSAGEEDRTSATALAKKSGNGSLMACGYWPIEIETLSLKGKTLDSNQSYISEITLKIQSN